MGETLLQILDGARYGSAENRLAAAEELRLMAEFRVCTPQQIAMAAAELVDIASVTAEPLVANTLFWVAEEFARSAPVTIEGLELLPERFDAEPELILPFLSLAVHDGRRSLLPAVAALIEHADPAVAEAAQATYARLARLDPGIRPHLS